VLTTRTSDGLKRYQLYSNSGVLMHTEDQRSNEVIDYINLEGQLVAERTKPINSATVTTKYQHSDLRGSPTVVTNAAGTQIERSIEQPFGAQYDGIYRDGPAFTGHATDAASGLSYMQQRYYDPIAMRFLSVDPAQSEFSRYAYGANNPYKYVDPDGREIVAAQPSQTKQIESMVNSLSAGRFKFDDNSKLQAVSGSSKSGSNYYKERLIEAIDSPKKIVIEIFGDTDPEMKQALKEVGGGATLSTSSGDQSVGVMDEANQNLKDESGKPLIDSPKHILMHELVGHAIPNAVGSDSGNAVTNENRVRTELDEPLRKAEKDHGER
jgi:RHS repeat-associated protein